MKIATKIKLRSNFSYFLFFNLAFFIIFFLIPSQAFAAVYYDVTPPPPETAPRVANSLCGVPVECANSHNPTNCGLATCTAGNDWTKYELTCVSSGNFLDPYDGYYQQGGIVYSIGDKCVSGEFGLRSSSCTNQMSDSMYKTCCSYGTPSLVNPGSCVQFEGDTTNPPWEGICPAGYQREMFCGPGTGVICGQPACGPGIPADCTTNPSCTGGCTPNSSNTCSAGNGTQGNCTYYGDGTSCIPAPAPDQPCTIDNCSPGFNCNPAGSCIPNSTPCDWTGKTADPAITGKGWDCGGPAPGYGTDSCAVNACVGVPYQCNADGTWTPLNPSGECTASCTNCRIAPSPSPSPSPSPIPAKPACDWCTDPGQCGAYQPCPGGHFFL